MSLDFAHGWRRIRQFCGDFQLLTKRIILTVGYLRKNKVYLCCSFICATSSHHRCRRLRHKQQQQQWIVSSGRRFGQWWKVAKCHSASGRSAIQQKQPTICNQQTYDDRVAEWIHLELIQFLSQQRTRNRALLECRKKLVAKTRLNHKSCGGVWTRDWDVSSSVRTDTLRKTPNTNRKPNNFIYTDFWCGGVNIALL